MIANTNDALVQTMIHSVRQSFLHAVSRKSSETLRIEARFSRAIHLDDRQQQLYFIWTNDITQARSNRVKPLDDAYQKLDSVQIYDKKDELYSFDDDHKTLKPFSMAAFSLNSRLGSFTENVDTHDALVRMVTHTVVRSRFDVAQ